MGTVKIKKVWVKKRWVVGYCQENKVGLRKERLLSTVKIIK